MPTPVEEVRLRTYEPGDVAELLDAVVESKAELMPWMSWCHEGYSERDARDWVSTRAQAWQLGIEKMFVIAGPGGRMLGGCGLHRIDPVNGVAEAGYWVRTSEAGRGAATWALGLLIGWGFQHCGLHRIEIIASVENKASHRVAEKARAVRESVQPDRLLLRGRRHDAVVYVASRPDA